MQGSAKGSVSLFRRLCGADNLGQVMLVNTIWNKLDDYKAGVARETEIVENEEFWGCMVKRGSQVERHYDTVESARRLIEIFLARNRERSNEPPPRMELAIQREMVDEHKVLESTSAGQEVCNTLDEEDEEIKSCTAEYSANMNRIREERGMNRLQELEDLEKEMNIARNKSEKISRYRQADVKKSMATLIRDKFDKDDQEPEEEKKERLAKEYAEGESTEGPTSRSTSQSHGRNSSSFSIPLVVSSGITQGMGQWWSNRDPKHISMSMSIRGKYCSLIGPAYRKS